MMDAQTQIPETPRERAVGILGKRKLVMLEEAGLVAVDKDHLEKLEHLYSAYKAYDEIMNEAFPGLAPEEEQQKWLDVWCSRKDAAEAELDAVMEEMT